MNKPIINYFFTHRGSWFYLLNSLIFLLIIYPFFENTILFSLFNCFIILSIIHVASINKQQLIFGIILAIPTLILNWLPGFNLPTLIFAILFYLYALVIIAKMLRQATEITMDEIFGAVSMYILLGFTWSFIYQVVEIYLPNSFYINPEKNIDHVMSWMDYVYFSFTTLTTLGYGDIVPITSHARSLAITEAISGVLFVGVMVASVIGIFVTNKVQQKREYE